MKKGAVKSNRKLLSLVAGSLWGNGCRGPNLNQQSHGNCSEWTQLKILQPTGHHTCHRQLSPKRANLGMVFVWPACSILLNNYLLWISEVLFWTYISQILLAMIIFIIHCPTSCIFTVPNPPKLQRILHFLLKATSCIFNVIYQLRGGNLSVYF